MFSFWFCLHKEAGTERGGEGRRGAKGREGRKGGGREDGPLPCSPGQSSQVDLKLVTGDTPVILSSPRAGVKGLCTTSLPWATFHAESSGVGWGAWATLSPNICSGKSLGLHLAPT